MKLNTPKINRLRHDLPGKIKLNNKYYSGTLCAENFLFVLLSKV